jgi:hypothetical protein
MEEVPADHPLRKAWDAYKNTDRFENSRKWAEFDQYRDGSLWAAFEAGWRAGRSPNGVAK